MDRHRLIFLLILTAAMLARLAVLRQRTNDLATDPDGYVAHARMVLDGFGFAGPYTRLPTAFRPPGYPLLIAALPAARDQPERAVALLHLAAGILTVLATRELADRLGLPPGPANLAALMVAVDPLLLRYTALPMTEVVSALLLTAALVAFTAFRNLLLPGMPGLPAAASATADRDWRKCAAYGAISGIALGVGALVRPVILIVTLLLTLAIAVAVIRRMRHMHRTDAAGKFRFRGTLLRATIPMIFLLLTISPWIIRNYLQFHQFIAATTHGGYTLALGNNSDFYRDVVRNPSGGRTAWDGQALDSWQQKMTAAAADAGVAAADERAMDSWMYQQAIQVIREQPMTFVHACWLRVRSFFSIRTADGSDIPTVATILTAIWYSFVWLLVAVAGAGTLQRSWLPGSLLTDLWLSIAAFLLIHTVYWTDARMRAPLVPCFSVLAAFGLMLLSQRLSHTWKGSVDS